MHAMYSLVWYDAEWAEIGKSDKLLTAHELIMGIDLWSRRCQRVAADEPFMITPENLPTAYGIEVRYVER